MLLLMDGLDGCNDALFVTSEEEVLGEIESGG
jgi:hypothetical protein